MHQSDDYHQSCREECIAVLSAADIIFIDVIIKYK
jgi:hypothetical protein